MLAKLTPWVCIVAGATGKGKFKRDKKLVLEFPNKATELGDQKSIQMLDMMQKKA